MPEDASYRARIREALGLLCGELPPEDLVNRWVDWDDSHVDLPMSDPRSETLQDWAAQHCPFEWAMGITVIDAAEALAIEPRPEGEYLTPEG
jgi:hypothetical protein